MNVFSVSEVPTVHAEGYDDPLAVDLVAHFIGIVHHHNDNTAPRESFVQEPRAPRPETH